MRQASNALESSFVVQARLYHGEWAAVVWVQTRGGTFVATGRQIMRSGFWRLCQLLSFPAYVNHHVLGLDAG
jgi:hypothetical protein